ncbi:hypothetical protein [Pontiella sp.]|uniref:hypothetical protein n=1 Tax=Pontiella sp. TaxID=2837462 RepID=UPI0035698A4B
MEYLPYIALLIFVVAVAMTMVGKGGRLALKAKPVHLKQLFAYTNWVAAGFMIFNALHSAS